MISYRFEETIARTPEDVWRYAADIGRHPEWMGVMEAEVVSGDPERVGAVGRETLRVGPKTYRMSATVSAAEPGRLIAWRFGGDGPLAGEVQLELEPVGPGSRAVWSGTMRLTGLWRLLEPIMAAELRAGEANELRRLKAILEARATPARDDAAPSDAFVDNQPSR